MKNSALDGATGRNGGRHASGNSPGGGNGTEKTRDVLHRCMNRLQAESASIFVKEENRDNLWLADTVGARENHHCEKTIRMGEGVSGSVAIKKEPLLLENRPQQRVSRIRPRCISMPTKEQTAF